MTGKKYTLAGRFGTEINWDGVMLGWAVAFGVSLILGAPVIGVCMMVNALGAAQAAQLLCWAGVSGATFLAFLYGGYVSGGSAHHSGLKHGLLVPLLNLSVALSTSLFVLVSGACITLAQALIGAVLPSVDQDLASVYTTVSVPEISPYLVIPLLLSFLGGTLGGIWGSCNVYHKRCAARQRESELIEAMRAKQAQ